MTNLLKTKRHIRALREGRINRLSGKPYKNTYTYLGPNQEVYAALFKQGWDEAETELFDKYIMTTNTELKTTSSAQTLDDWKLAMIRMVVVYRIKAKGPRRL